MDQLSAMRVFVAVVDGQGFSAASRALSIPLPTVSRKISELEQHLDAQLLVRTTRKVTVTDSGQRFYEDARRILDEVSDAERRISGEYRTPKGRLSVTAPTLFGRLYILPIVNDFLREHPEVDIQLNLTNMVVDLLEEEVDVGIRIGALPDSTLVARQVGTVRSIVCGGPGYLADHGYPLDPGELINHSCVAFLKFGMWGEWSFKTAGGKHRSYPISSRLALNSIEGTVAAAVQNVGLARLYSYQAARHVADGNLEIVLKEFEPEPHPVQIIYPQARLIPQKLRAFIDFAAPRLRTALNLVEKQCGGT